MVTEAETDEYDGAEGLGGIIYKGKLFQRWSNTVKKDYEKMYKESK